MRYDECIEKRLLVQETISIDRAKKSIEIAGERLLEAEKSFADKIYSGAIILAYAAMFHAARGLLFKDGFREKNSHACVGAYLNEKYGRTGKIGQRYLTILENARFERHEVLYGLEPKETMEEAQYIVQNAKKFVKEIAGWIK